MISLYNRTIFSREINHYLAGNGLTTVLHMLNNVVMVKVSYFYTKNLSLNVSVNQGVHSGF